MNKTALCIISILLNFFCSPLAAQSTVSEAEPAVNFALTEKQLNNIEAKLNQNKIDKNTISEILENITQIQNNLKESKQHYSSELDIVQKSLDTLGPKPEKENSESKNISQKRKEFTLLADNLKSQITQTDILLNKIEEINNLILKIRNRQLLNNILVKQSSIFHPKEFWQSLHNFGAFILELTISPFEWYNNLPNTEKINVNNNLLIVIICMLCALGGAHLLKIYIKQWFGYLSFVEHPDYSQKIRVAIWMFIARGVIPAAIIGAFILWLKSTPIIYKDSFGILLQKIAVYLLYYYTIKALIKTIFSPYVPKWRIIETSDERAISVCSAFIFTTVAVCIVSFLQSLADEFEHDISAVYAIKIIANAVKVFCIIWITRKALYDEQTSYEEETNEDVQTSELSISSKAGLLITVSMSITFSLSLFGYIRLSEYIINHFMLTAIIVGTTYISNKLIIVILHHLLRPRFWTRNFGINRKFLLKTEFWFGLFFTPIIWIFSFLIILALWGVSVDLILARIKNFLIGFNIGGIHISITSILLGIISFFVVLSLFKILKSSFINGNLSKIEMNIGIKNSVISSINFLGFIISGLIAIAVMGGNLGSLAIIAGALSFGVGLGLQNMVGNLAAGMTILWERPIKIGDWILIGGQEGIVKKINIRSTEIEAWDKSTVIIPNSDILSQSLINYTYSGQQGRISIKINVNYDSDIDMVKETLLNIARSTTEILNSPTPSVFLTNFNDSGLEFQLNCFTNNIFNKAIISNNLREKIILRFGELNIILSSAQKNIYWENFRKHQSHN